VKSLKLILIITLIMSLVSLPVFVYSQTGAVAQAKIDANKHVSKFLWFGAGCLFGLIGVGAAYLIAPNPPASALLGKDADWVTLYTDAYRSEGKRIQGKYAIYGCLTNALVYIVYAVVVVATTTSTVSSY